MRHIGSLLLLASVCSILIDANAAGAQPAPAGRPRIIVIVSANAEWRPTKARLAPPRVQRSPYGEFFETMIAGEPVLFLHGGWGKISAAGSAEYAITRWQPRLLINLGTVGGIDGRIDRFARLLATRTIVYDIHEAMGDSSEAIADYSTTIDLSWLDRPAIGGGAAGAAATAATSATGANAAASALPIKARRAPLLSGDRDLVAAALPDLQRRFPEAVAADWESGAIAYVAARHETPVLILRGVSDLVSPARGEAAGNPALFADNAAKVMDLLLADLSALVPYLLERLPPA